MVLAFADFRNVTPKPVDASAAIHSRTKIAPLLFFAMFISIVTFMFTS
jgi:hypothetical protein